jgi:superfamily II DNA helicase RecQ
MGHGAERKAESKRKLVVSILLIRTKPRSGPKKMKILHEYFKIPVQPSQEQVQSLSTFIQSHAILTTIREFVSDGPNSFWAYDIEYGVQTSTPKPLNPTITSKPKVDYREVLNESDFKKFSALRDLRKEIAQREGLPVYAIFTNEHLALMVQNNISTSAELSKLDGVGKSKRDKYFEPFIKHLALQKTTELPRSESSTTDSEKEST